MSTTSTVINFEKNENLFYILDGWMEKYNTSPKKMDNLKEICSLTLDLNSIVRDEVKRDNFITEIKKWAATKDAVVVITNLFIVVCGLSALSNSTMGSIQDLLTEKSKYILSESDNIFYPEDFLAVVNNQVFEGIIDESGELSFLSQDREMERLVAKKSINPEGVAYRLNLAGVETKDSEMESEIVDGEVSLATESGVDVSDYLSPASEVMDDNEDFDANIVSETPSNELVEISQEQVEESIQTEEIETIQSESEQDSLMQSNVIVSGGREIYIPASVRQTGLCPNYTSYSYFYGKWSRGTGQRVISDLWGQAGMPSSNGIATLNGRYLVALSPKFGVVGDNVDIVLSDGQIIPATIADIKGADATSEWGHVLSGAIDIVEWEATGSKADINLGSWRNVTVQKIINYGSILAFKQSTNYETAKLDDFVQFYSDIYGLNANKVDQILKTKGNDFTKMLSSNKEKSILMAIRDIYFKRDDYGVTNLDIEHSNLSDLKVDYAEYIEYFADVLGVDPALSYTVCKAASASFSSPMFFSKNNPTNIMSGGGEYLTFPTKCAGFIETDLQLLSQGECLSWNSNILDMYNYIANNYDSIFGYKGKDGIKVKKYTLI